MMGMERPRTRPRPSSSELELSAVVRGDEPDDGLRGRSRSPRCSARRSRSARPETRIFTDAAEALDVYPRTPHAVRVPRSRSAASRAGSCSSCPNAFVVRMTRALDELGSELPPAADRPRRGRRPRRAGPRRPRSRASRCASGPSSAARGCPPPGSSACRPARWSSSTRALTSRSTLRQRKALCDRPPDGGGRHRLGRADRNGPVVRGPSNESKLEVARWPESW